MTNHENLSRITKTNEPVHEEAAGMLLARIWDDYERDSFVSNYGSYMDLYKGMYKWLNDPAPENRIIKGVTPITIRRVDILIEAFDEWDNGGASLLDGAELYLHAANILDDLEKQAEPIGDRYIDAADRWAVFHAMENIHAQVTKMPTTVRANGFQTYEELRALREHLMKKWEKENEEGTELQKTEV